MTQREIRMRCIEALTGFGVREPARIITDAEKLADWVMSAEDKAPAPRGRPKKD